MGRPRRYASDAERQRAYRERKAQEPPFEATEEHAQQKTDGARLVADESPRGADLSSSAQAAEDAYVERELEITRRLLSSGALTDHDGRRLERSEAYARMRFRGVLDGSVAAL